MPKLAINGGLKIRTKPFQDQLTYGDKEKNAIYDHMHNNKLLSNYRGNWIKEFWGGEQVRLFEQEFAEKFNVKYSIAVNSCTSALQLACIAIGLQKDDEVIVTPWSMSCSATAPLICGAKPIFVDIEKDCFCIEYESVKKHITNKTKAIIAVDLFGQIFDSRIKELAKKKNIIIIEDAAQGIGAMNENGEYAGTIGDIGCFSFTQGKHLTAGEGGMLITNNYNYAMRLALLRNHAEAVVSANDNDNKFVEYYKNLYGFNMRMTELQAVILREQLKKLDKYIQKRNENHNAISHALNTFDFISVPEKRKSSTHSYYCDPYYYEQNENMPYRDIFIDAVKAELTGERSRPDRPMLGNGYIRPLYRMPIFNEYEEKPIENTKIDYPIDKDTFLCIQFSNVESLWRDKLFINMYHSLPISNEDISDIYNAFEKVYNNKNELKDYKKFGWHKI